MYSAFKVAIWPFPMLLEVDGNSSAHCFDKLPFSFFLFVGVVLLKEQAEGL